MTQLFIPWFLFSFLWRKHLTKSLVREERFVLWITITVYYGGRIGAGNMSRPVTLPPQWHRGTEMSAMLTHFLLCFILSVGPQPVGWCHPRWGWVLPSQLVLSGNTSMVRGVSPGWFQTQCSWRCRLTSTLLLRGDASHRSGCFELMSFSLVHFNHQTWFKN